MLTGKQARNRTTIEVERQWMEVWPEIANEPPSFTLVRAALRDLIGMGSGPPHTICVIYCRKGMDLALLLVSILLSGVVLCAIG